MKKRVIESIQGSDPSAESETSAFASDPGTESETSAFGPDPRVPVTITAPDDTTEIWVNREKMAIGKWEGQFEYGYYTINTVKDGLEGKPVFLWVDEPLPIILDLRAPQASYGLLNIHSNVVGATVKINGVKVGVTPCVVENLPDGKPCEITLTCEGYKIAKGTVTPIGNDMVDVELKMKKG